MASGAKCKESSSELRTEVWLLDWQEGQGGPRKSKGSREGEARVLQAEACLAGRARRQCVAQGLTPWDSALCSLTHTPALIL